MTEENQSSAVRKPNVKWRVVDIVVAAIVAVASGVIFWAWDFIYAVPTALFDSLTPGLGGLFHFMWLFAGPLVAIIIRKPGAALITEVLASAIELLMGNSGGATVVLTGLIQGVGCELGFAVFRYRKYNLLSMALSGVFAAVCIFCYELYYLSYYLLAPTMLAAQLAVRFASAVVFSGVIAKLARDGLARTGVLRSYAVGARLAPVSIDDEEE